MRERYDVVVVGAGPSGAVCAEMLAARGASVLVVDKKRPGWHKPCGGGIPESMFRPWQIPLSLGFEAASVRVVDVRQRLLRAPLRYRTVYRNRFDEYLAEKAVRAGAEVVYDAMLLDVQRDGAGFAVRTSQGACEARYLVGADGCMSTVRRKLFPEQLPESSCALAIEHWYRVPHGITTLDFYVEPEILGTGYAYVFPKDREILVIGVAGLGMDKPRTVLERLLELPRYRQLTRGAPVEATHGARIPYRHLSRLRDGRLLLLGDAAGLNTPIVFAGLPIALLSGRLAGEALGEAIASGSDAPLERYSLATLRPMSPGFEVCHAFYDHLLTDGRVPSFARIARSFLTRPHKLPRVLLIHRSLARLVDGLDLARMAALAR
ncbi:geranylgeranyl reductase family protein [Nannocystis radixulma]|uniref:NAD(P)/FAD-dependent oxidoreductase n=1 Tax=Nannocystis radixulma TaxID=2995305 RepID=A0ABT5BGR3_9BACT|nr:NAD(P)/FAD-dependent oxidoreductase [Nannocystis radixulma]MDC0673335.1 NAD(P)/FAD-dependent oxidoreductase [Nannocystis radixulma]